MSLKTKYIFFVTLLHAVAIGLSLYIFKEQKLYFILSEVFILISLFIAWQLYEQLIQPIRLLMTGASAIKDRDFNVKFLKTGKQEMDELIAVYNLMIDELRHERTQQEEQHYFLEKLIKTSPTGIIIFDYEGNITARNPKAEELLTKVPTLFIDLFSKDFKVETHGIGTFKIQKAHFIDRGFPRYFVMIEELTAEILAAEKKAYGKVIRMMAHEVNNSIGAVNSILDTTFQLQTEDSELKNALQIAIERNDHLNHFMRNFADVVRIPEPTLASINLTELLEKVILLMKYRLGKKEIRFEINLPQKPISIKADAAQMEQVFINIFKNAVESIDNEGVIKVFFIEKEQILQIEDNGRGIPKAIESQLFSPFFSTKSYGQGIGLTLIRVILLNHGFEFSLKTVAEKRTVFEIRF